MRAWTGAIVALVLAVGLAIMGTTPPQPGALPPGPGLFDLDRAMADVKVIASAPHPTGSAENAKVRAYITDQMRAIGMEVSTREGQIDAKGTARLNQWSGRNDPPARLVNLVGVLPGKDRTRPAVLLMSHHDSVWGSPGAADDTAGVAASLEVARQVAARGQPQRDLILLITDGEELGLQGARQFFAADPLLSRIGAVINMEARGGGGRTTLFETSANNGEAIEAYRRSAAHPGGSSLAVYVYSVLPNDSDLSAALDGKWAAWNFAFIGRPGLYHSPLITPERLDQGGLQDMGWQVAGLTRELLAAPKLPGKAPDVVFFDLFGLVLVSFATGWGWAMLALAGAALVLAAWGERDLRAMEAGAGRMAALMLFGGGVLYGLNLVSGVGKGANYYDRLAAIPMLEVMALLACVACFLAVLGKGLAGPARQVGAALPLALIALAAQAIAPTAAYVAVVPLLVSALAILARAMLTERKGTMLASLLAAPVIGYQLALGHQLMQGVGPTMPFAAVLPLALGALALAPNWSGLGRGQARKWALTLFILGLGVALWVRFDPVADTVAVYSLARG
jgi:hypothetical protein